MPLGAKLARPAGLFILATMLAAGAASAASAPNYDSNHDSHPDANSGADPSGLPSSEPGVGLSRGTNAGKNTDSAKPPPPVQPTESPRAANHGMSSSLGIAHLEKNLFSDQKAIWTSPLHLPSQDKSQLAFWGIGTLVLVAA